MYYILQLGTPLRRSDLKRKPFPLPELMLGNSQLIVSEKIKKVVEANDDETHQFHPISLFGEDGKPLDEPQRYGLMVNRVVEVPEPRAGMKIPKHYGNIGDYKLNSIEDTPGLATALADFPIWSFPFSGTSVVLNEKMMRAILDSDPVGIKMRSRTGHKPGENIQEIWFAELN